MDRLTYFLDGSFRPCVGKTFRFPRSLVLDMVVLPEDSAGNRKRVSATQIGCILIACLLAVPAGWVGWQVYETNSYYRMVDDVCDKIASLKTKRPANIKPEHWDEALDWAHNAIDNVPLGGPRNRVPMQEFHRAFNEQMAAGDRLAVLRWTWDELERRNVRGREYALCNKPIRAMTPEPITDATLSDFWAAATCGDLELSDTQITDSGLLHLEKLTELWYLGLSRTRVTDAGLAHVASLHQLHALDLDGCRISDAGLVHLKELKQLEQLSVSDTEITDAGVRELEHLTKLQWLFLTGANVTDRGVAELQEALPNCRIER